VVCTFSTSSKNIDFPAVLLVQLPQGATPVQLVFGRDITFKIITIVDWRAITDCEQKQFN
jgi:hypothetical protein